MEKWTELKNWIENGIKSFEELADEAQFNYPNSIEYNHIHNRKREFEQFLDKMNEIEKLYQHKYRCLDCGAIFTSEQWDIAHKQKYGACGYSVGIDNRNRHMYVCPNCSQDISGGKIEKIY
jgi:DNA-directed RNA polymerase subunit RPC12/RpoP